MKRLLRRIPALVSAYRQARVLGWVLQDWCWSDAEKTLLGALRSKRRVLKGCLPWSWPGCSGVTACDVSPVVCARAAERCKEFPTCGFRNWIFGAT